MALGGDLALGPLLATLQSGVRLHGLLRCNTLRPIQSLGRCQFLFRMSVEPGNQVKVVQRHAVNHQVRNLTIR